MKTIELTPEEIEMIEAKRKEAEIQKQKEADELNAYLLTKRSEIQNKFAEIQKRQLEMNTVIEEAFSHCPKGEWVLINKDITFKQDIYKIHETGVLETMEYIQDVYEIHSSDKIYKIYAEHVITWDNKTSYYGKSIDKGIKLFVSGNLGWCADLNNKYSPKPYSNIKLILKKIETIREAKKEEIKAKEKQASAVDTAVKNLQVMYPDAVVIKDREWERSTCKPSEGQTIDIIKVTLANQTHVTFKVYSDGSLSRKSLTIPKEKTQFDLLNVLNNL